MRLEREGRRYKASENYIHKMVSFMADLHLVSVTQIRIVTTER